MDGWWSAISHRTAVFDAGKTGKKKWELPLFPGYLFVKIAYRARLQVLTATGAVQVVSFDGKPAAVRNEEIEALRQVPYSSASAEPHSYLSVGQRVRVRGGPLSAGPGGACVCDNDGYDSDAVHDRLAQHHGIELIAPHPYRQSAVSASRPQSGVRP
jgi:hypothetical protein